MASSFASRQRARGRIDPKIDGRAGAAAVMAPSRPGSPPRRVAARPLEAETDLADRDDAAEADRGAALARRAVDERAVRAPEVLDVPGPAAERQDRVLGRHELVLDDDGFVDVASDRRDRVERKGRALGPRPGTRGQT